MSLAFTSDIVTKEQLDRLSQAIAGTTGFLNSSLSGAVTASSPTAMTVDIAACAAGDTIHSGTVSTAATSAAAGTAIGTSDPNNPRIDLIVLDSSYAFQVRAGSAAADPVPGTLTAGDVELAAVKVNAGVSAITSSDITDRRQAVSPLFATKGSDIAAASTLPVTNQYHHVTGTTTITALPTFVAGMVVVLEFDAATPITYNATSLILAGGANYTAKIGDVLTFVSEGSGNWRQVASKPASYIARSTSDFTKNNSSTLGDVTGIAFPIGASEVWAFQVYAEAFIGTSPDIKVAFTVPSRCDCHRNGVGIWPRSERRCTLVIFHICAAPHLDQQRCWVETIRCGSEFDDGRHRAVAGGREHGHGRGHHHLPKFLHQSD